MKNQEKRYVSPELEKILLAVQDIVTESNGDDDNPGDWPWM
jgi:hypothetical protein